MMQVAQLSPFERLVLTEAAVRQESVYRNQEIRVEGAKEPFSVVNPDRGRNPQEIGRNLYDTFLNVYDFLFQDSSQHHKVIGWEVCNTEQLSDEKKLALQKIFTRFAEKNYDDQGKLRLSGDAGPNALLDLYAEIKQDIPLHNRGLALGSLFVQMGLGDKWKAAYPDGIDFTRGQPTHGDIEQHMRDAFNGGATNHPDPKKDFFQPPQFFTEIEGVLFPSVKIHDENDPNIQNKTHLVTKTGHLVNLTNELRENLTAHLREGKSLDDFKIDVDENQHLRNKGLENYNDLPSHQIVTEALKEIHPSALEKRERTVKHILEELGRLKDASIIDGTPVKDEQGNRLPVSLMASNVDIMTGLRMVPTHERLADKEHDRVSRKDEFERFVEFLAKDGKTLADLVPKSFLGKNIRAMKSEAEKQEARHQLSAYVASEMDRLIQSAGSDEGMKNILYRASRKVQVMMPLAYEASDRAFMEEGSNRLKRAARSSQPHMYMTMGGTATGKGSLTETAMRECGGNLVVASLDDSRMLLDQYWLYPATNNHRDDYWATYEFGEVVRDLIKNRALEGIQDMQTAPEDGGHVNGRDKRNRYNILIDGSGIPYEKRNDAISKLFKNNGYHVSVVAAQAPLFVNNPELRDQLSEQGLVCDEATIRLGWRLLTEFRGLPMEIVKDKHIGFALASRNAARDPNVDWFTVQDVSMAKGQSYTLSYILTLDERQMNDLVKLHGKELKDKILSGIDGTPQSVKLPQDDPERDALYNLKVIRDNGIDTHGQHTYRVEIITDIDQYTGMVQKGLYNRKATSCESLDDNIVHADLEGHFQNGNGKLKSVAPKGVIATAYPDANGHNGKAVASSLGKYVKLTRFSEVSASSQHR